MRKLIYLISMAILIVTSAILLVSEVAKMQFYQVEVWEILNEDITK